MRAARFTALERGAKHGLCNEQVIVFRARARLPSFELPDCLRHRGSVADGSKTVTHQLPQFGDARGVGFALDPAARNLERALHLRRILRLECARDARAEHEALQQRVAREAISAVQARGRDFTTGPQAGE